MSRFIPIFIFLFLLGVMLFLFVPSKSKVMYNADQPLSYEQQAEQACAKSGGVKAIDIHPKYGMRTASAKSAGV